MCDEAVIDELEAGIGIEPSLLLSQQPHHFLEP
jgi:hypothetical protein